MSWVGDIEDAAACWCLFFDLDADEQSIKDLVAASRWQQFLDRQLMTEQGESMATFCVTPAFQKDRNSPCQRLGTPRIIRL